MRAFIAIFIAVILSLLVMGVADAAFKYTDAEGGLHIVDDISKVPAQYRDQVKTLKENMRTDGYVPSYEEATSSDAVEGKWYKLEEMSRFDRYKMVYRASMIDLKGILNDMKFQFAAIAVVILGLMGFIMFKVKGFMLKMMLCSMLLVCLGMVGFGLYMKTAMSRGDNIMAKIKELRSNAAAANPVTALGAGAATALDANGKPLAGALPSEGGGGVMEQLEGLKSMSKEREAMLQEIFNDSK